MLWPPASSGHDRKPQRLRNNTVEGKVDPIDIGSKQLFIEPIMHQFWHRNIKIALHLKYHENIQSLPFNFLLSLKNYLATLCHSGKQDPMQMVGKTKQRSIHKGERRCPGTQRLATVGSH